MSIADSCDVCGKELTSPESIARHRGTKCHIVWLEKRITELELQNELTRAAVTMLLKEKQRLN